MEHTSPNFKQKSGQRSPMSSCRRSSDVRGGFIDKRRKAIDALPENRIDRLRLQCARHQNHKLDI